MLKVPTDYYATDDLELLCSEKEQQRQEKTKTKQPTNKNGLSHRLQGHDVLKLKRIRTI